MLYQKIFVQQSKNNSKLYQECNKNMYLLFINLQTAKSLSIFDKLHSKGITTFETVSARNGQ